MRLERREGTVGRKGAGWSSKSRRYVVRISNCACQPWGAGTMREDVRGQVDPQKMLHAPAT